eukprot:SAG25_NODE_4088_length_892_cov_8.283733_1_plen_167_part_10
MASGGRDGAPDGARRVAQKTTRTAFLDLKNPDGSAYHLRAYLYERGGKAHVERPVFKVLLTTHIARFSVFWVDSASLGAVAVVAVVGTVETLTTQGARFWAFPLYSCECSSAHTRTLSPTIRTRGSAGVSGGNDGADGRRCQPMQLVRSSWTHIARSSKTSAGFSSR